MVTDVILSLEKVKESVIGIFKMDESLSLIVKDNGDTVDMIHISNLGGVRQEYGIPSKIGKVCIFPDGKNMNEMLKNPFAWNDWYNENLK